MSLETTREIRPTAAEEKKQSKRAQAEQLALQYKDLPQDQRKTKIMEEVPCSRSVANKAMLKIDRQQEKEKEPRKPSLKIEPEEKKSPEYLPPEKEPMQEIEKKPVEEKPIEELTPEELQEQLDLFQDMLRGIHVLIFGEGGVVELLVKAGRPEKQCHQVADQLYRWLRRRYTAEDLERWDTLLLIASYGTLLGGIIKDVIAQRRKQEEKKKP